VYHVKGGGAFGYFEVTTDVTQWTKAAFLNKVGKRTPLFLRFSIVAADEGAPDTDRDVRGVAIKLPDLARKLSPCEVGHRFVGQHEIEALRLRAKRLQSGLGGGSPNDLAPALKRWKESFGSAGIAGLGRQ
jgi:hypothetical protein